MRKTKTVTVTRGLITGSGANKTEAKADLEQQIDHLCTTGTVMEVRFDHLIILTAMAGCAIGTRIIRPDDLANHGRMLHHTCVSNGTLASELMRARYNVAQNVWSPTFTAEEDENLASRAGLDQHFTGELRRYIAWQRDCARLIAEGKTPSEAHQLASGLALAAE